MIIVRSRSRHLSKTALEKFLVRAQRAVRLKGPLSVLITSSREMRSLNRRFRGKNKATDVLSFPAAAIAKRESAGDLAISAEIAARNALALGHSVADEMRILLLHGVLHLAGYDHETDDGEMAEREASLRKALGLPAALIERAGSKAESKAAVGNLRSRRKS